MENAQTKHIWSLQLSIKTEDSLGLWSQKASEAAAGFFPCIHDIDSFVLAYNIVHSKCITSFYVLVFPSVE